MILFQYIRKYYLIFRFKELIRGIVCIIIILYRGNKMATEFLIACILFTIQIIEILRAKILKQILLRLFCRERVGIRKSPENIGGFVINRAVDKDRYHTNFSPLSYCLSHV